MADFTHLNHMCLSCDLYGESLSDKLQRVGALPAEQVLFYLLRYDIDILLIFGGTHICAPQQRRDTAVGRQLFTPL